MSNAAFFFLLKEKIPANFLNEAHLEKKIQNVFTD